MGRRHAWHWYHSAWGYRRAVDVVRSRRRPRLILRHSSRPERNQNGQGSCNQPERLQAPTRGGSSAMSSSRNCRHFWPPLFVALRLYCPSAHHFLFCTFLSRPKIPLVHSQLSAYAVGVKKEQILRCGFSHEVPHNSIELRQIAAVCVGCVSKGQMKSGGPLRPAAFSLVGAQWCAYAS